MKRSWTYIVSALFLSTLALSACGKKGGGGNAAPPATGADNGGGQPDQPVNYGRGNWYGQVQVVKPQLLRQLLKKANQCNQNCQIDGLVLGVRLIDGNLPGRGEFNLRTFKNGFWRHQISRQAQGLPYTNGFQLVHNMDGYGWWGGTPWNWNQHGGKVCYWRQTPPKNNGNGFWIGGHISTGNGGYIGGSYQQGFGQGHAEWVCEESMHIMSGNGGGPQFIDNQLWIGNQVQIVAEFKDASKTIILVKLFFRGQLVAQGEINGVVY